MIDFTREFDRMSRAEIPAFTSQPRDFNPTRQTTSVPVH